MKKKIIIGLIATLVIIQFFRIDKTNPTSDATLELFAVEQVPTELERIVKTSCFDCHSNQVTYPWYSNVAPVSWVVKKHINEGRDELNFSEWGSYSIKRKLHKLEEIEEMVGDAEMPLPGYLLIHGEARLSKSQQKSLVKWAKELRTGQKSEVL